MTACLCLLSMMATTLLLHAVHETVSELEWNPKTSCVEVALRLDVLDEQWLDKQWRERQRSQASVAPPAGGDGKGEDVWQRRYLMSHLWFDPPAAKPKNEPLRGLPIRWIGRKVERGHVWWFFEVVCKKKPPSLVRTDMLFDRDSNYRHLITVRRDIDAKPKPNADAPRSLLLTMRKNEATLNLATAERPPEPDDAE